MSTRLRILTNSVTAILVFNAFSMAAGYLLYWLISYPYIGDRIGEDARHVAARYFSLGGVVVLIFTGIAALWVVSVTVRHVTGPLHRIKQAASEIRDGNLNHELAVSGHDEFSELAACFEQMRIRLKDSTRLQERAETERRAMIASVTHDLKTPITSIMGYAEGIIDGVANTPSMIREYATVIRKKALSLQALSDDLSLLSRIENAELPLDKRKENLGAVISEAASEFSQIEPEMNLALHLAPDLMASIDKEKFARVLVNIMQNSVKYKKTDQCGPNMTITLVRQDGDALLTMSDDGMGIAQNDLPHVFDRFYRADASRGVQSGSGLGLSIARQLVSLHGGKIWILNNVGSDGITVHISLPLSNG